VRGQDKKDFSVLGIWIFSKGRVTFELFFNYIVDLNIGI
jgi:hypothetical protein